MLLLYPGEQNKPWKHNVYATHESLQNKPWKHNVYATHESLHYARTHFSFISS